MLDLGRRNQPGRVEHEIRGQFFLAHLSEMRCVRAVVTADNKQKVHLDIEELAQCILAFLGCAANGIKEPEVFSRQLGSVPVNNGALNPSLYFLCFPPQHGGLICDAHSSQMHVGIESDRMRTLELFEECLLVAAVADVFANVVGIRQGQHDEVVALPVTDRARTGCFRLLVFGFAVNDGSSRFARVFADPLPHAHHVAARGIDNLAAAVLDLLLNR